MNLGYDILDPCRVKVKKGGSAFIPTLKGGDFPLRPLHPRKLKKTCTKPNEPLEGFEPPIC